MALKTYRLTKLTDDIFEGNHPNDINEGWTKEGILIEPEKPTLMRVFWLDDFRTSIVIREMNDEGIFKTINSTYKLEEL